MPDSSDRSDTRTGLRDQDRVRDDDDARGDHVLSGDRLLDANEVAALLNVPVRWVRDATRAGKLPHVRLGRYRRYDSYDVLAWVEVQKAGGVAMSFRKHAPRARNGAVQVPGGGTK